MLKKKQQEDEVKEQEANSTMKSEEQEIATEEEAETRSEWQIKAEEHLADLQRTQADFENYRKRQAESQKELGGYLIEKLILDIVPVLDNFRSATMHVPPEQKDSPWVVGIQYIEKQLEDVVKSNGVEVIEAKEGDVFDPTIHEAVDSQQSTENNQQSTVNDEQLTDTEEQKTEGSQPHVIGKVLQKGFRLGGKVIRPAKVTVS
jgi:molecular chaperone GrpE